MHHIYKIHSALLPLSTKIKVNEFNGTHFFVTQSYSVIEPMYNVASWSVSFLFNFKVVMTTAIYLLSDAPPFIFIDTYAVRVLNLAVVDFCFHTRIYYFPLVRVSFLVIQTKGPGIDILFMLNCLFLGFVVFVAVKQALQGDNVVYFGILFCSAFKRSGKVVYLLYDCSLRSILWSFTLFIFIIWSALIFTLHLLTLNASFIKKYH